MEEKQFFLSPELAYRLAAIDIGTNSIRLIVAEPLRGGNYRILDEEKESTRLGEEPQQDRPARSAGDRKIAGRAAADEADRRGLSGHRAQDDRHLRRPRGHQRRGILPPGTRRAGHRDRSHQRRARGPAGLRQRATGLRPDQPARGRGRHRRRQHRDRAGLRQPGRSHLHDAAGRGAAERSLRRHGLARGLRRAAVAASIAICASTPRTRSSCRTSCSAPAARSPAWPPWSMAAKGQDAHAGARLPGHPGRSAAPARPAAQDAAQGSRQRAGPEPRSGRHHRGRPGDHRSHDGPLRGQHACRSTTAACATACC